MLAVERKIRQTLGTGTCCQYEFIPHYFVGDALRINYPDKVRIDNRPGTLDQGHLPGLEGFVYTAHQGRHHLILAGHDGRKIRPDLSAEIDAVGLEPFRFPGRFRRALQGLGGNTSPVQAGSPESVILDNRHPGTQFRPSQGGHVPTWPGAQNRNPF